MQKEININTAHSRASSFCAFYKVSCRISVAVHVCIASCSYTYTLYCSGSHVNTLAANTSCYTPLHWPSSCHSVTVYGLRECPRQARAGQTEQLRSPAMAAGKCNLHSSWLTLCASDVRAKRRGHQDGHRIKVSASVACRENPVVGRHVLKTCIFSRE